MKKFKISKIAIIGLLTVMFLGAGVFWVLQNRTNASTIVTANSNGQVKDSSSPTIDNSNKVTFETVPILMYHYIRIVSDPNDTIGANLSVSPENFKKQLDYLSTNNYQAISMQQLRDGFAGSYKIDKTKKPIVITFDDGYDDAFTQAYPILKSHGMIGVFYIISGQIGQSERMTSSQIIDLDKNGMAIGSHTKNHLDISTISTSQLSTQLSDSKTYLEQLLGHPIVDFCYPAGKYNQNDIEALKIDGYLTATTTKSGIADTTSDLFELPRIRMQNDTNLGKALSD
jgi:peptidoglycan/xylan/chitin deacetylase (PgdA/CDA1 family)